MLNVELYNNQAESYSSYRPLYPDNLFRYLYSLLPNASCVWDCGTGNGQAARGLAKYFPRVIASDAGVEQIRRAAQNSRIDYRVSKVENSGLPTDSVDLITIGNALHWFPLNEFYQEAQRILHARGWIVAWCYKLPVVTPEVDSVVFRFDREIIGSLPQIQLVDEHYSRLPFPFRRFDMPEFSCEGCWTLERLIGYLSTLSGSRRFQETHGYCPTVLIESELRAAWGDAILRDVRLPLHFRAGINGRAGTNGLTGITRLLGTPS